MLVTPSSWKTWLKCLICRQFGTHRVGIMSLKSSPGGQSFNFNTMGRPSGSCSRSAFMRNTWHLLSVLDTSAGMHRNPITTDLGKIIWVLTGNNLKAIPEVSHLYIRDNSTVSTIDQIYVLVSKLLAEGVGPPQLRLQAFMYPWHQHRLATEQRSDRWQQR